MKQRDKCAAEILKLARRVGKMQQIIRDSAKFSGRALYDTASEYANVALRYATDMFVMYAYAGNQPETDDRTAQRIDQSKTKFQEAELNANAIFAKAKALKT